MHAATFTHGTRGGNERVQHGEPCVVKCLSPPPIFGSRGGTLGGRSEQRGERYTERRVFVQIVKWALDFIFLATLNGAPMCRYPLQWKAFVFNALSGVGVFSR